MAGPTHVDDDRVITAGILQNAQTSLKGAFAICHRSDGAVSTRSARNPHINISHCSESVIITFHALFHGMRANTWRGGRHSSCSRQPLQCA